MAYKQGTDTPLMHCFSKLMHTKPWNKMRERTAAVAGRGSGNKVGLAHAEKIRNTPLEKNAGPDLSLTTEEIKTLLVDEVSSKKATDKESNT